MSWVVGGYGDGWFLLLLSATFRDYGEVNDMMWLDGARKRLLHLNDSSLVLLSSPPVYSPQLTVVASTT